MSTLNIPLTEEAQKLLERWKKATPNGADSLNVARMINKVIVDHIKKEAPEDRHNYFKDIIPTIEALPYTIVCKPRQVGYTTQMIKYIHFESLKKKVKIAVYSSIGHHRTRLKDIYLDAVDSTKTTVMAKSKDKFVYTNGSELHFINSGILDRGRRELEKKEFDMIFVDEFFGEECSVFVKKCIETKNKIIASISWSDREHHKDFEYNKILISLKSNEVEEREKKHSNWVNHSKLKKGELGFF